jgi:YHS domain-containing protein
MKALKSLNRSTQAMLIVVTTLALATAATTASAADPINTTTFGNLAVKGFDAVAYFTEGEAVKGSKKHSMEWMGATWRFATAANLEAFAAEPERYAPQYGGYCAWAVSQGQTAGIDPQAWSIVGGKLYLNYSHEIKAQWEQDIDGNIAAADASWPTLISD